MNCQRIIHQIHLGGPDRITPEVYDCLYSVGERHPTWTRIIWDEGMLDEIEAYAPRDAIANPATMSNWLRLQVLFRFGGVYLDTDIKAHAHDACANLRSGQAMAAIQDHVDPHGRICNAVMSAPPGHPWIKWQIDHWHDFDQTDAASGVYLATAAPRELLTLIPTEWVYPYLWDTPKSERRVSSNGLLEHLWSGSWVKGDAK